MDIVSKAKRSQMMSGIKSKNTKPEIIIRKYLFSKGLRYRINQKIENIKPDIVLKKYKTCIFVHGCFWHRHPKCKLASQPKSNQRFWNSKFKSNISRDKKNINELIKAGWKVGIIWECSVRSKSYKKFDFLSAIQNEILWTVDENE